ncbi:alpha-2-macroglobulin [Pleionea sp. CnH1-48]|uniref:alpha-2-macroglobulin family protein n=1 Tax=Pleionea sp. CnH1-48 TaxID=2954494 RepID=UPI0020978BFD|nr:alpha-2-macroglobulin [Pleionea sp. CnH1-48]MCO7226342.1 alpha-2-macroglobulin family protein [Pleionea sp. CnH1-48]
MNALRAFLFLCSSILLVSCQQDSPSASPNDSTKKEASQQSSAQATSFKPTDAQKQKLQQDYANTPFKVLTLSEQSWDNAPALAVVFSVPLNPDTQLSRFIKVSDKDKQPVTGDWILSSSGNIAYFPFIQPDTKYHLEVLEGITAINNRLIKAGARQTIKTRRAQSQLRFASHGSQLSTALSDGLTIDAVNIDAADFDFWRVKKDKLSHFMNRYLGRTTYDLENIKTLADLVYSARFDLDSKPNQRKKHVIPLTNIDELKQSGVYVAIAKGAGHYPYRYETTWFTISDIGLQVRQYPQQTVAFAHHLLSADPAQGATITILDHKGNQLAQATTDNQGFANFDNLKSERLAIAELKDNYSVVKLNTPAMDLSEFKLASRQQRPLELFIYSARDLYRPGETIRINALLRDNDARLVQPSPIKIQVKRPDGRSFKTATLKGNVNAFYSSEFEVPKNTLTGEWRFIAKLGNGDKFEYNFSVEDFLPERMKLELSSKTSGPTLAHEKTTLDIQGDYFYGAPAAGNRFETTVEVRQQRTLFDEQWKDFIFGAENYNDFNSYRQLPDQTLDAKGHAKVALNNEWQGTQHPLRVTANVSLFESGGRPVTRRWQTTIWPKDAVIGIRPMWEGNIGLPNSELSFEVINVNRQGELVANDHLDIQVIRENSHYYWQWGDDGWSYQQSARNQPIFNQVVKVADNARATLHVPVNYGYHRIEVRDRHQRLLSSYQFFAGWRWDQSRNGEIGRPDQVKLSWNQDHFAAGETAQLSIDAPYSGTALVTIEANQLLWQQQTNIQDGKGTIEIPVSDSWQRHDIYASVMVLRAGEAKRKHLPKRAFGVLHLPLNRANRELKVAIDVPTKVEPETEVVAKIKLQNPPSNTTPTQLTLVAIDSGILSLSDFETPNAHEWFFAQRRYQGEIRDIYSSLIEQLSDNKAQQRFGGDADELSHGGDAPQTDVQIVSLLSDVVDFNDQGEAEVTFQLPYFNGEVRFMALAFGANQFGHADKKMTIAAPVVAEVSLPRFLAKDDESNATFDVQNLTDEEKLFDIQLTADPALGSAKVRKQITLAPKEKSVLQLPLVGSSYQGQGKVAIELNEKGDSEALISLQRDWKLGLRPGYPAETRQKSWVVPGNQNRYLNAEELSGLFRNLSQDGMKSVLNLSPKPPFNAQEQLQYLIQYPYGCLEQTSSRAWPLLLATDADLKRYDRSQNISQNRGKYLEQAIARISAMQRSNGSFGLWSRDNYENHWLTVYATELLLHTKQKGYSVDDAVLNKAIKRLQKYATTSSRLYTENSHYTDWPHHYHFAYRAYASLVLAKIQKVKLGDLRNLRQQHAKNAKSRLPLAQLALAFETMGDQKSAQDLWQQALDTQRDPDGYAGDYGSILRNLAWVTVLATESKLVKNPWQLVQAIREELLERRWISTQERFALYRLSLSLQTESQQWQATLKYGEETQQLADTQAVIQSWVEHNIPRSLSINNESENPLFGDFKVQGYPAAAPRKSSEGIEVQRTYYNDQGQPLKLSQVETGDLVLVRLDVNSEDKKRIPDALIVELLPAGLELENQNLMHATKMDNMRVGGKYVHQWMQRTRIQHQEYRDDRFVAAIDLDRRRVSTVFYLARAVTPGHYQVPPTLVEDMYRPYLRAIGNSSGTLTIKAK